MSKPPTANEERKRTKRITTRLLEWYRQHQRQLPWRRIRDPYATWISEVMLQQTQVATVVPYFERWMQRFPTVEALANAPESEVLVAWQGLGYYSRARNLQRAAQAIERHHVGALPRDPKVLLELPGIGRYTAGAIASIAYDQPFPAVDGNVMRVISRVEALRGDPRVAPQSERIWSTAAQWVACDQPSAFNQALMELGALVCVPEQPRCGHCPLVSCCRAYERGLTNSLPELAKRQAPEARYVAVLVSQRGDKLLLLKQPASARHWASLDVLPHIECARLELAGNAATTLVTTLDSSARLLATEPQLELTYPITRFRFRAAVFTTSPLRAERVRACGGRYVSIEELSSTALPAPHRRICEHVLGARRDKRQGGSAARKPAR